MQDGFFKELLDNLYDGVYFVDKNRIITFWNRAAEKITGYQSEEVLGKGCFDNILVHVDENGNALCESGCPLRAAMHDGISREMNAYLRHKDGHRLPVVMKVNSIKDARGKVQGGIQSFNDNSSVVAVKERAADLEKMALIDDLTGVGNRRYADMSLQNKLAELKRYDWNFGVLFADIDFFKDINDAHGHEAGDEILKMVAQTILSNMRSFDFIFRWGGEEFLLIITNVDSEKLYHFAERLRMLVQNAALRYGSEQIKVTMSVGGTIARSDDTLKSIMRRIDELMYSCKHAGRNKCCVDRFQSDIDKINITN
ncbi:MAG: GGDEF domain-containing protein [Dehalococcoidia bacterium]|nr:GGDEF domain-containing protein [Dehalococcoidia bacterium]MDD5495010.1 GGDEF domain-containing protein [Dehalococcoidia bacterium]